MFDGSHRSRRTIDLSSGGRRGRQQRSRRSSTNTTLTTTRPSALEEARIQRQERRQLQRREHACKQIQRIYRGYDTRKRVAKELSSSKNIVVLSMRLSLPLRPFLDTTIKNVLMEYQGKKTTVDDDATKNVFARQRILGAALQELHPPSSELLPLVTRLLQQQQHPTTKLFVQVIMSCQEWLLYSSKNETITRTLYKWCCQHSLHDSTLLPLLAALVFCNNDGGLLQQDNNDVPREHYQNVLLPSLMAVLTTSDSTAESSSSLLVSNAVSQMVKGHECILLKNGLDLWKQNNNNASSHAALLKFVQLVLERRPDLALLTSLVVKGDTMGFLVNNNAQDRMDVASQDENDDDDDTEEEEEVVNTTTAASAKRQRSSQLLRKDLQTVPKLDRLYQESMTKLRKQLLGRLETAPDKDQLVELALQLGNPNLWLEWANAVFVDASNNHDAIEALVLLLFTILQSTTGLRTRAQSTFLSQLAFHRGLGLLGGLWQYIVEKMAVPLEEHSLVVTAAMTVFCDLFAHHLLVLHDEEFLRYYTNNNGHDSRKVIILAQDVIARLGQVLYQVYWTKPVLAADLVMLEEPATTVEGMLKRHRARLLLSGTKLWNSLYERWCRLVRHSSFCDESAWWFPRLMSKDADEVVNARMHATDIDDDDDDGSLESMDVDNDQDDNHGGAPSAAEQESNALAEIFRDPKMARILTSVPQALPFERRVKLFSSLLVADKQKTQDDETEFRRVMMNMAMRGRDIDDDTDFSGRERVEIRRDVLYDDSMSKLNKLGRKLKKKVQVTFINQHGAHEAGIDGGGVFKEFLDDLIKEAFDPSNSSHHEGAPQLFSVTPSQTLSVNSAASYDLSHYEFLGRVLGKAVYESILVEPQFCLPFLNQLLGKQNTLDDLKNFDAEYYKNLIKLRNLDAKEIDGLGMTFELTTSSGPGNATRTRELMPGGGSVAVTKQNVIQYVHLVAHQRLNVDGALQTRAFLKGFRDLIPGSWVRLFSSNELQKLISGDDSVRGIDVRGMKACMRYSAGYHPSQPIIVWFWEVVEEMTPEQQRKFLKFMTSCSRQPLLGFQALEPLPCVQQLRLPENLFLVNDLDALNKVTPLPTSATCMNLLKLPNYRSKALLKKKLLDAVESGAGFELT